MPRVGTGRVFQRGKVWWIQYGYRGEDLRESSKSTNQADAKRLLKKRLGEMGRGRLVGPSEEKLGFDDLATMIRNDYEARAMRRFGASTSRSTTSPDSSG